MKLTKNELRNLLDNRQNIEAFLEGKKIQYLNIVGIWVDINHPSFVCHPNKYRVKPEPVLRKWRDTDKIPIGSPIRWKREQEEIGLIVAFERPTVNGKILEEKVVFILIKRIDNAPELTWNFPCTCQELCEYLDNNNNWQPCGVYEN